MLPIMEQIKKGKKAIELENGAVMYVWYIVIHILRYCCLMLQSLLCHSQCLRQSLLCDTCT